MLTTSKRAARFYYLKFLRLRGEPKYLAKGVALGVFIGITPTIPLHTMLILALAIILRTSKVSALLAAWVVSNPLTFFAQYYFSWWIGKLLFPGNLSWEKIKIILQNIEEGRGFMDTIHQIATLGGKAIAALVAGGCLLAIPFTVAGYFVSLNIFQKIQTRRQKRRAMASCDEQPS